MGNNFKIMNFFGRHLILYTWLGAMCVTMNGLAEQGTYPYCQILDNPLRPAYWAELSIMPDSTFAGFGESSFVEIVGGGLLGYYYLPHGDLDLALEVNTIAVLSSAGIGLPDLLVSAAVDIGWTLRDKSGAALQFRVAPGLYTDVTRYSGRSWNMPVTIALIQSLSPSLSSIIGVEMRPFFETPAMPLLGVEWELSPRLRVKAQLPESRMDWFFSDTWMTSVGCEWRSRGFYMEDGAGADRKGIEVDELRARWQLTHQLRDDLSVGAQVGYVFDRSVRFRRPAPSVPTRIDLESNVFLGVTLAGPF